MAAGDYVVLSVADTGHGMPPEVRARAFEPFFTTKAAGKGSGLGLATIYGFARQSGGNVTIYSEVGKGTTVNLYLPRAGRRTDAESPSAKPAVDTGRGETVLVVEDDERVRRLTALRLKELGYRVLEAGHGAAALAVLAETPDIDDRLLRPCHAGWHLGLRPRPAGARTLSCNARDPHLRLLGRAPRSGRGGRARFQGAAQALPPGRACPRLPRRARSTPAPSRLSALT